VRQESMPQAGQTAKIVYGSWKGQRAMDVMTAIKTKWAVRQFSDQPVPDETVRAILEAGRQAQSSKNTQPWEFVVVRDRSKLEALSRTGDYAGHLAGADFAIALVSPDDSFWRGFDLGQTAAYLQLAAWEYGVGSCIAAIYHPDQARAVLGIPDDRSFWAALSFGYPAPDFTPAKMGGRKPLDEVTHWDQW
jgi:nitroreductase